MTTSTWTTEQILALAPDSTSAKAGQGLANARKWVTLGANERTVWGECQGSGAKPYQAEIDLHEPAFKCTCPSRKFPCKHTLGLFLLFAGQPAAFKEKTPPLWVTEWLTKRDQQVQRRQAKTTTSAKEAADPAQQARQQAAKTKRVSARQTKVAAGLAELELWLCDLVRQGLAVAQSQPPRYWENMAARLVDAQAPGLARWLREMSTIPASGEGWTGRLLARLGLLYLLLTGFKQLEILPEATQADIRSAIGWTYKEEELLGEPSQHDTWLVLGQRIYEEERLRVQRTWVQGQSSGRTALLLDFAFQGQALNTAFVPGRGFEAELIFYPSNYPLRAIIKNRLTPATQLPLISAYPNIEACLKAHAAALARQPWLELFPIPLEAVSPVNHAESWFVRDNAGQLLPLSPSFDHTWRLLAISGGQPLFLFGEWDGYYLWPLSAWVEGRFIRLYEQLSK